MMNPHLLLFHWLFLGAGLIAACAWDIKSRRVPNWLTVGMLAAGLTARFLTAGFDAVLWGVGGAVTGLVLLLYPFARGWIGAGDVKLLIACGGWLGPLLAVQALLFGSVAGGVVALLFLVRSPTAVRRDILQNLRYGYLARRIPEADARPTNLAPPYAPAIAVGVAVAVALDLVGVRLI